MDAFIVALVGFPTLVTKVTDLIRNAFDRGNTASKWVWNVVPFALGVGLALLYELNYASLLPGLPSRLGDLSGVPGQAVTGLAIGAVSSGWHEVFDALSSYTRKPVVP